MIVTLKKNEVDPDMIEMWVDIDDTPSFMAIVPSYNFMDLVGHLDELDGETVIEMKVIDNE